MYHVYTVPCFVIGSVNNREADKYLYFLTPDFGVLGAKAKGLRRINSKLRFFLQDYSFTELTLVRGKKEWHVTNVRFLDTFLKSDNFKNNLKVFARIVSLVRNLSPEESENKELFLTIKELYKTLNLAVLPEDELFSLECIGVMRVLRNLGYLPKKEETEKYITCELSMDNLKNFKKIKNKSVAIINECLESSHLSFRNGSV